MASDSEIKRKKKIQKKLINQDNRIQALKKQLVYYKEISETIREPLIILDKELNVVTANLAFYRKFKVKKQDTEGQRIYDLGNSQWSAPGLRILLENILPTRKILNNYAVTHKFPSIGTRTILLNARQVDNKQLILLAMEDVTTKLKLKLDSAEMTKNLIKQRDRLQGLSDAKEEFISLASHQLRTPATVVKQYVGMLSQGYAGELTDEQLRLLDVAYKSNERQLEVIEDLLRVARVDAGKVYIEKTSCNVVDQVQKVIDGQAILFKNRNQEVVFKKPSKSIQVSFDPKLMLMVIDNLLDNASKYSGDGQTIHVSINKNRKFTVITVKDNGVGIRKSDQKKLFKKFFRSENDLTATVGGTGLGLYWAKKILDLHNGKIVMNSKLNSGSTFKISIPNDASN